MHRFTIPFLVVAVALIGSLAVGVQGPGAGAQDAATPVPLAGHPLVGSWLIAVADDPARPQTLNTFWADGNALFTVGDGTTFQGTWVATGPRTAALTLYAIASPPGEEPIGLVRIASSYNEVDETGDTFSGEAVIETIDYDGAVLESAPVSVIGTRITLQPVGTPAAGEMAATPAA
jgi:hypothetical protein